jgi:hypothetical protein
MNLLGIRDLNTLQRTHAAWMDEALKAEPCRRDESGTRSLAVGSQGIRGAVPVVGRNEISCLKSNQRRQVP